MLRFHHHQQYLRFSLPIVLFSSSSPLVKTTWNPTNSTSYCFSPQLLTPACCFHNHNQQSHPQSSKRTAFQKQQEYQQQKYKEVMKEIKNISRKHKSITNSSGNRRGGNFINSDGEQQNDVQRLHGVRQRFSTQITRLTPQHFEQMTLREVTQLLRITSSLAPVNGSSHVASNVAAVLPPKLEKADIYECTNTVIQLLEIVRSSIYSGNSSGAVQRFNRQHVYAHKQANRSFKQQQERMGLVPGKQRGMLEDEILVDIIDYAMQRLIDHFSEMASSSSPPPAAAASAAETPNGKETSGEHDTPKANNHQIDHIDDAAFRQRVILRFLSRSNDKNMEHLFSEDILRDFVSILLSDPKSFGLANKSTQNNSNKGNAKTPLPNSYIIAVVATSICKLRLLNPVVVDFFKWAAPICITEVDVLSGNQIGYILDAFSLVGYHHPALFIALGEKAGELGELLREDEVARILNALGRTKIEHSKLRASLESSMRMKTMHKRATTMSSLF